MANIFDVSKYILERKKRVTSWELQKLCYYCKAWSLALEGDPMFPEAFLAWADGPACRELFSEHRGVFWVEKKDISKGDRDNLSANEADIIDAVIDAYCDLSGDDLRNKTHSEMPWIKARGDLPEGAKCNAIISEESIMEYYRESDEYDQIDDRVLMRRAERRISQRSGKLSFNEMVNMLGISAEDIANAEDLEIEFG